MKSPKNPKRVYAVKATKTLVEKLCRVGFGDKDEMTCRTVNGKSAADNVRWALKNSAALWIILFNKKPVAAFGVVKPTLLSDKGRIAMLCSNDATCFSVKRALIREGKKYITRMLKICSTLENYEYVGHTIDIRWLAGLGFDIGEPVKYGVKGLEFVPFSISRGC